MNGTTKWQVSLILLLGYLAAFHIWMVVGEGERIAVTGLVVAALIAVLVRAKRQNYFLNRWDLVFHAAVVLDIFVEGFFVSVHDDLSFYLCALGFGVVIGAYRSVMLRRIRPT